MNLIYFDSQDRDIYKDLFINNYIYKIFLCKIHINRTYMIEFQ